MPAVCCAPVICAHVLQTIPDCLRVKYLRADARMNARPSSARMSPVDACSLLRARALRACAPDYPRLPVRHVYYYYYFYYYYYCYCY